MVVKETNVMREICFKMNLIRRLLRTPLIYNDNAAMRGGVSP